jgi:predicted DNA-binding helix-hairpin-helix protein
MRFYGFEAHEILEPTNPFLDLEIDPKLAWALRHREQFPVNINTASKEMILRIPGIGTKSTGKILMARRFQKLTLDHLKKMGVAINRAKYFVAFENNNIFNKFIDEKNLRNIIISGMKSKYQNPFSQQLSLF